MLNHYWCLPLTNLVTEFGSLPDQEIESHPLRLKYTDRTDQPLSSTTHDQLQESNVITFVMAGRSCFVQPVANYGEIVQTLRNGNQRYIVTAYAVGAFDEEISEQALEDGLATRLRLLLSLGSGQDVGTTGLTKYSAEGKYSGWTAANDPASYFRVWSNVHDDLDHGMSDLLDSGLASEFSASSTFRVATRMFVRSGDSHLVIEERLALLFRSLERLCDDAGIPSNTLSKDVLPVEVQTALEAISANSKKELEALTRLTEDPKARSYISDISRKTTNFTVATAAIGTRVAKLLSLYGFKDAVALESVRFDAGGTKLLSWPALLRDCRNLVQHGGFFDTQLQPQWEDLAYQIYHHLHDIVLRVLLRLLGFTKNYQPSTIGFTADFDLNWVTDRTSLQSLGYHRSAGPRDMTATP